MTEPFSVLAEQVSKIQFQADVLAFVVGSISLAISSWIAILLHRLSKKVSQQEAIRAVNQQWDSFNSAMLDPQVHDLYWGFIRSTTPFDGLGDRAHPIVQMYLNTVHTEFHSMNAGLIPGINVAYLDKLIDRFVPRRDAIVELTEAAGYDPEFIRFLRERLSALAGVRA